MYKVMLVDDDYPVLELIQHTVDWNSLGLQVIGLYENGATALEAAAKDEPDILITDIGMPRMNGLELISRLKERKPNLRAAILSCHSEFDYVRQAVKLQVQDYLLKDTLEPADISKLLAQFIDSLKEEREFIRKREQMEFLVDRNRSLLKEKFIRSTLQEPIMDGDKWRTELESFGLPKFRGESVIPIVIVVDEFRLAKQRYMSDDVLRFAVDNVMEEAIAECGATAVHFNYNAQESVMLASFASGLQINGYAEVKAISLRLQEMVKKSLKLSLSFLIGSAGASPSEIKASIQAIRQSRAERFYREHGTIIRVDNSLMCKEDVLPPIHETGEKLREWIMARKYETIRMGIDDILAVAEVRKVQPETVKEWALKLLLSVKLKLQSVLDYRSHTADVNPNDMIELDTLTELKGWMIGYCLAAHNTTRSGKGNSRRTEVAEACQFVALHLDKKISLDEVAEQLYMNPSYFSRLFKKETGETFIEYVTRMKMHRAKEMLDQTSASVGKICETLGYDNQSYFIKLFKTFAGVTPVEYRTKQKRESM